MDSLSADQEPSKLLKLASLERQMIELLKSAEKHGRVTLLLRDAYSCHIPIEQLLGFCSAGLKAWASAFEDFKVMLPFRLHRDNPTT